MAHTDTYTNGNGNWRRLAWWVIPTLLLALISLAWAVHTKDIGRLETSIKDSTASERQHDKAITELQVDVKYIRQEQMQQRTLLEKIDAKLEKSPR